MSDSTVMPLYFEDFKVGDVFRSGSHKMDEEQIVRYAREFDPQPFHTDPMAAGGTFFRGLAASGWHTASLTMKLLVGSMPFAKGIIGASAEVSWPRATRPGDTLSVQSTVVSVDASASKPDRGMVTLESLTVNQNGETCQRMMTKVVAFRPGS